MKPFNLEAAIAGAPVVTKDGTPVYQITLFDVVTEFPVVGVVAGDYIQLFTKDGRDTSKHSTILFMAPSPPVKKYGWINIYSEKEVGSIFPTKEAAMKARARDSVATIQIEWEE